MLWLKPALVKDFNLDGCLLIYTIISFNVDVENITGAMDSVEPLNS